MAILIDIKSAKFVEKNNVNIIPIKKPYLRNTLYTKLKKLEYKNLEQDAIKI